MYAGCVRRSSPSHHADAADHGVGRRVPVGGGRMPRRHADRDWDRRRQMTVPRRGLVGLVREFDLGAGGRRLPWTAVVVAALDFRPGGTERRTRSGRGDRHRTRHVLVPARRLRGRAAGRRCRRGCRGGRDRTGAARGVGRRQALGDRRGPPAGASAAPSWLLLVRRAVRVIGAGWSGQRARATSPASASQRDGGVLVAGPSSWSPGCRAMAEAPRDPFGGSTRVVPLAHARWRRSTG